MVATQNKSFFFAASQVQNTSNKLGGVGNGGVDDDDNCEGWVASHSNTTYYPDDSRYEYEPGQRSCWGVDTMQIGIVVPVNPLRRILKARR